MVVIDSIRERFRGAYPDNGAAERVAKLHHVLALVAGGATVKKQQHLARLLPPFLPCPGILTPCYTTFDADALPPKTQGKTGIRGGMVADSVPVDTINSHIAPDLETLIDAWQDLPPKAIRASILAMVWARRQAISGGACHS